MSLGTHCTSTGLLHKPLRAQIATCTTLHVARCSTLGFHFRGARAARKKQNRPSPCGLERRAGGNKRSYLANLILVVLFVAIKRNVPLAGIFRAGKGVSARPGCVDETMLDRNLRARLGAKIRADQRLSHATRCVGTAILFACTNCKSGRSDAYRARIAHEAACSERTVSRAFSSLRDAGYITISPTYQRRHRSDKGRWYRPRGPNVVLWTADLVQRDKLSALPRVIYKPQRPEPLPDALAGALARLGHAIADAKNVQAT